MEVAGKIISTRTDIIEPRWSEMGSEMTGTLEDLLAAAAAKSDPGI